MRKAPRRRWPWGLFLLGPLLVFLTTAFFFSPAATWALKKSFAPMLGAPPCQRINALSWKIGPGAFHLPSGPLPFESLVLTLPPWPTQWPSGATLLITPSDAWDLPNNLEGFSWPETPIIKGFQKVSMASGENPMTIWWGTQTFMARGLCTFEKIGFEKGTVKVASIRAHLTNGIFRSPHDGLILTFPSLFFESEQSYKLEAPSFTLSTPAQSLAVTALSLSGSSGSSSPPMAGGTLSVNQLTAGRANGAFDVKNISTSFFPNSFPLPFSNITIQQLNITAAHLSLGPRDRPLLTATAAVSASGVAISKNPNPFRINELNALVQVAGAGLRLRWKQAGASGLLNLYVSPFDFESLAPLAQTFLGWRSVSGKCLGISMEATLTPRAFQGRCDFYWQGLRVTDDQNQALPLFRPQNRPGQGALPLFIDTANARGTVNPFAALPLAGLELFQGLRRF